MKQSAVMILLVALAGGLSAASPPALDTQKIVSALFPDNRPETRGLEPSLRYTDHDVLLRDVKYLVTWTEVSKDPSGGRVFFVAVTARPVYGEDEPSDYYQRTHYATIREHDGSVEVLHRLACDDGPKRGLSPRATVDDLSTATVAGKTFAVIKFNYSDETTPRGFYHSVALLDFSESFEPRVVWIDDLEFDIKGSGVPPVHRTMTYKLGDFNNDGIPEIEETSTTITTELILWNGSEFEKSPFFTLPAKRP